MKAAKVEKVLKKVEKKVEKKEKKKRGVGSVLARGALKGVSSVADHVLPGSGSLLSWVGKAALNKLGLSEKIVVPEGYGGGSPPGSTGQIVASADAPVAFGRMDAPSSFAYPLHEHKNGDKIMHIKEAFRDMPLPDTTSSRRAFADLLYPTSSDFAITAKYASCFQLYKILGVKLHYTHWAPTSTQARVTMWYAESNAFADGSDPGFVDSSMLQDFAAGSCYEDFALEFYPQGSLNWYQCYPTPAAGDDADINYQGIVGMALDLNSVASLVAGTVFIEWIIAFSKQRPTDITIGLTNELRRLKAAPVELARAIYFLENMRLRSHKELSEYVKNTKSSEFLELVRNGGIVIPNSTQSPPQLFSAQTNIVQKK